MSDNNRMEVIWGTRLLDEGFTSIPNILLRNFRKLGIEHGEMSFINTLLTYKHDHRDPFPSRKTLADHLCCSERQIDKWVASLEKKSLLLTGQRKNRQSKKWDTRVYNFKPLLDACLRIIGEQPLPAAQNDFEIIYKNAPQEPEVLTDFLKPQEPEVPTEKEPEVLAVPEPEVLTKKKKENNNKKRKKENNNIEKTVVVDPLKNFIEIHNLNISDYYLKKWRSIHTDDILLLIFEDALNRKTSKGPEAYIAGVIKNGYKPSAYNSTKQTTKKRANITEDKLPDAVLRQEERERLIAENPPQLKKKQTIMDDPELKALYEDLRSK